MPDARLVGDAAALREALMRAVDWDFVETFPGEDEPGYPSYEAMCTAVADALIASGVVQPREDVVREAKAEALRDIGTELKRDHDVPVGHSNRSWQYRNGYFDGIHHAAHVVRRAATLAADPGMDRPAVAEDGQDPRWSGTGGAR